jgi:hypothetical protein
MKFVNVLHFDVAIEMVSGAFSYSPLIKVLKRSIRSVIRFSTSARSLAEVDPILWTAWQRF